MKLSLLASVLALSTSVFAVSEEPADGNINPEEREIVTDPNFVPTPEKPFNFKIDYNIAFKEDVSSGEIANIYNGETIELLYTFQSLEPSEVSIVGVGGELLDPITGENVGNITASQIGPISVANNETVTFGQKIGINMNPMKYVLVPAIYIVYQEQFMMLGSRNKIISVEEPVISFFNPQLLIAELILGATIAGIGYFLYNTFAAYYLAGILPVSMLPAEKKKSKKTISTASKDSASTVASGKSTDFESWLPDSHKKLSKKQKKKL